MRYYVCDKRAKKLMVFNEPKGRLKEEIHVSKLYHVEAPEEDEGKML